MPEDRYIQMLKVSLPYMNPGMRETCKTCIRLFEINQVIRRLDEEEETLCACSQEQKDPFTAITRSIRDYCTPRELETLDMITNMLQMTRLYQEHETGGERQ